MTSTEDSNPPPRVGRRFAWRGPPEPTPRVQAGRTGQPSSRSLSEALTEMLGQRVRVTFAGPPRWMSGFDAVVLVLRERAVQGDFAACSQLADLLKYAGPSKLDGHSPVPATSPEDALDEAFARRARDQSHHALPVAGQKID